jgi:DnaJ-domain-containing protein 1
MTSKRSLVLCSLVAIVSIAVANSFHIIMRSRKQQSFLIPRSDTRIYVETRGGANGKTKFGQSTNVDDRFLSDFKTADGSSVDPYKMLQISRSATIAEIKQSYRRLSRKLHPDMVAQSDVLPGRW